MKRGTEPRELGSFANLKSIWGWVGIVLVLFNLLNTATMGFGPLTGLQDSEWQICRASGQDDADRDQDRPTQPHSHESGACCLSLCCGVATTASTTVIPQPTLSWQTLAFDADQSPQRRPAPSLGGIARAPPTIV